MPTIPCPQCSAQIEFDFKAILSGKDFTCKKCNAKITIQHDEAKEALKNVQAKMNKLKNNLDID